jgi:hypothetical protein
MGDILIRPLALPARVYAVVVVGTDGEFNIYINTNICPKKQREACEHEIRHIKLDHFYDEEPVVINEMEADLKINILEG